MVWWSVLEETEKNGVYKFPKQISTDEKDLQKWFAHVLILANKSRVTPLDQLFNLNFAFPFKLTIDGYELKSSDMLRFHREGSGIEMVSYSTAI